MQHFRNVVSFRYIIVNTLQKYDGGGGGGGDGDNNNKCKQTEPSPTTNQTPQYVIMRREHVQVC
jgi:hypothetical protein